MSENNKNEPSDKKIVESTIPAESVVKSLSDPDVRTKLINNLASLKEKLNAVESKMISSKNIDKSNKVNKTNLRSDEDDVGEGSLEISVTQAQKIVGVLSVINSDLRNNISIYDNSLPTNMRSKIIMQNVDTMESVHDIYKKIVEMISV